MISEVVNAPKLYKCERLICSLVQRSCTRPIGSRAKLTCIEPTLEWHLIDDNSFGHQGFEHVAWPGEEVVAFLASLEVAGFVAAGAVADMMRRNRSEEFVVEDGTSRRRSALEGCERLHGALEADCPWLHSMPCCGLGHHGADQVVREHVGPDLLAN